MYGRGFHYIGDWHTHPQARPTPSSVDLESIGEIVRLSTHGFGAFLLVVVGTLAPPDGLAVYLHSGSGHHRLEAVSLPGPMQESALLGRHR
jgi:integrative and conjugative element protein (TIGR02256 family)